MIVARHTIHHKHLVEAGLNRCPFHIKDSQSKLKSRIFIDHIEDVLVYLFEEIFELGNGPLKSIFSRSKT